jgi:hypothetical protein
VDEAGTTDVLCADKTGTLTQNALTVTTIHPMPGFDEAHVLALASLASSDGGQDPVDGAIRAAAARKTVSDAPKLIKFEPFDPARKMSEATATDSTGATQRIVKGAFAAVIGLAQPSPSAAAAAAALEGQGFRVLAVAAGPPTALKLDRNDALAGLARGRHPCGSGCIRLRLGFRKGSGLRSSQDFLAPMLIIAAQVSRSCVMSEGGQTQTIQHVLRRQGLTVAPFDHPSIGIVGATAIAAIEPAKFSRLRSGSRIRQELSRVL